MDCTSKGCAPTFESKILISNRKLELPQPVILDLSKNAPSLQGIGPADVA
jgi:hypothetical protein